MTKDDAKATKKPQDTLPPEQQTDQQRRFFVSHQQKEAIYTSEFIANLNGDGIIVDCSSGFVGRAGTADMELPIHTRLALTKMGAAKLVQLLASVLQHGQSAEAVAPAPVDVATLAAATPVTT